MISNGKGASGTAKLEITPERCELAPSWVLLLPSVNIGNIGQLAVDLILSTLPAEHIGHLRSMAVVPFAAPAPAVPNHKSSVITALEVYRLTRTSCDLIVVQQRSPSAKGRAAEHAQDIISWAMENGCSEILQLSSANAAGLRGTQLREVLHGHSPLRNFRVAMTKKAQEEKRLGMRATQDLKIPVLENADDDQRGWSETCPDALELDRVGGGGQLSAFLPSTRKGSFVRTTLEECEEREMPLSTLVQFVHEGDNMGDAVVMASAAALLLRCLPDEGPAETEHGDVAGAMHNVLSYWKVPSSWRDSAAPPQGLY